MRVTGFSLAAMLSFLPSLLFASDLRVGEIETSWSGELSVPLILDAEDQRLVSAELQWSGAPLTLLRAEAFDPASADVRFTTTPEGARVEVSARSTALAPGVVAHLTFDAGVGGAELPRFRFREIELTPAIRSGSAWTADAAAGGARRRGVRREEPKTSGRLIDEALEAGAIDEETALVYRVLADFDDPRLPAQYRGNLAPKGIDSYSAAEAAAAFETLSRASQEIVAPFLIPPFHEGSWSSPASNGSGSRLTPNDATLCGPINKTWTSVRSDSGQVRIWWMKHRTDDEAVARRLTPVADKALLKFVALLGRNPILDNGSSLPCRGGDDAIDVALVHKGSEAIPYFPVTGPGSSYVLLQRDAKDGVEMTLVHELFHVMQYTFEMTKGQAEYRWLMEATATWAQDHYSPAGNSGREHRAAPFFLMEQQKSLDWRNDEFEYGAYLFFQYLTRTSGDGVIRSIWEASGSMSALEAVDSSINGGFLARWPEFALYMWNSNIVDHYHKWDQMTAHPTYLQLSMTIPSGDEADEMELDLPHLSAAYFRYTFDKAPNAQSIAFYNGLTHRITQKTYIDLAEEDAGERYFFRKLDDPQNDRASVQALIRVNGTWRYEDWTGRDIVTFCRQRPEENVEEIVVIYSNSQFADRKQRLTPRGEPPMVSASNVACAQWSGTMNASFKLFETVSWAATGKDVVFEFATVAYGPEDPQDGVPVLGALFVAKKGTVEWRVSGSAHGCSFSGKGDFDLATSQPQTYLQVNSWAPATSKAFRTYQGIGYGYRPGLTFTESCPDNSETYEAGGIFWLQTRKFERVPAGGKVLKGTHKPHDESWPFFEWDFAASSSGK